MPVEIIQPQVGRVRVLSIPGYVPPAEVAFTVQGGTTGTQPTFSGDPMFTGSYVKEASLVHL